MLLVQKCPFFQLSLLGNLGKEDVFYNIMERKNAFLGHKKRSLKNPKIDIFAKRLTHAFCPKIAIFPTFFFRQFIPGKCLLRYSRKKKRLFRL